MRRSVLLVGGDSEIGSVTATHLGSVGYNVMSSTRRPERVAASRPFLDLAQSPTDWRIPNHIDAVCILAAIARLQDCAADPAGSSLVNITRTIELTDRLSERKTPILFLSTDKVFDGTRQRVPADAPTNPVSEYGRQKAMTEAALRRRVEQGAKIAILRLAKVVSPGMALLRQWIAALSTGRPVRAFGDMTLAPTPVALVAAAMERLLDEGPTGIFQLTGPRDVSYAELAHYVARVLGVDPTLVTAGSASSAGLPIGSTPRYTTLDSSALRIRYNISAPDVWDVVDALMPTCRE